jgi:hypothetical protein
VGSFRIKGICTIFILSNISRSKEKSANPLRAYALGA